MLNRGDQRAVLQRSMKSRNRCVPLRLGQDVDQNNIDRERFEQIRAERQCRRHVLLAAIRRDGAIGLRHLTQKCGVHTKLHLDRSVDTALIARKVHNPGRQIGRTVVQHVICTRSRDARSGVWRTARDHPRTAPFGQLHGTVAHGARAARDQQRLPCDIPAAEDRMRCCQAGDPECGPSLKRDALRQGHGLVLRQADRLGSRAKCALPLPVPDPDALTDAAGVHTCAHGVDHAGAVGMGNHQIKRGLCHARATARTRFGIRWVHARVLKRDAHFAGLRLGHLYLDGLQNICGRPEGAVPDCAHPSGRLAQADHHVDLGNLVALRCVGQFSDFESLRRGIRQTAIFFPVKMGMIVGVGVKIGL